MFYTNGSAFTKTFHGVTFKPGETKEVFDIINDPTFVLSFKEPPKCNASTNSTSGEDKLPEAEPVKKRRGRSRKTDSVSKENLKSDPDQSKDNSNKEV